MKRALLSFILCMSFLISSITIGLTGISAHAAEDSVSGLIDGILHSEMKKANSANLQAWLDGPLAEGAGVLSDWQVFSIRQYNKNLDFSSYASALKTYVKANDSHGAVRQQRYALLFIAVDQNSEYVQKTTNTTIGEMGIMSWVYGLHLLNNGVTSTAFSTNEVVEKLLALEISGGGWALSGTNADIDITAMVLQALAPHFKTNSKVKKAVDRAVNLLSARQMSAGDFQSSGMGKPETNAESTAQVITALSCLGFKALSDKRFIKNNNTLLDGLLKYQLADKSFSHALGGEYSGSATVQALYSLISCWRVTKGYGSLYLLPTTTTTPPQTTQNVAQPTQPTKAKQPIKPTQATAGSSTQANGVADSAVSTDASGALLTDVVTGNARETDLSTDVTTLSGESEQQKDKEDKEDKEDTTDSTISSSSLNSYKKWVSLAIVLLAIGIGLALLLTGKANKKNLIAVLLLATVLLLILFLIPTKNAATRPATQSTQANAFVTMMIQCDEAVTYIQANDVKGYEDIVPADGILLSQKDIAIQENETVLDVIKKVTKENKIILIAQEGYVSNIGGLVERSKDFGAESGWLYSVNGEFPNFGVSEYKLKDGDQIEFRFVTKRTYF